MIFKILLVASCLAAVFTSPTLTATNSYYVSTTTTSFGQGWAYCQNAGMKFLSIPTSSQNEALATYLASLGAPSAEFWIGAIYLRHGFLSQWYWVDGAESFSWTNFKSTPTLSSSYDNCIAYGYNSSTTEGLWVAHNCSTKLYFVCS